jgi:hypothetical protein
MVQIYTLTIVATGAKGEDGDIGESSYTGSSYTSAGGNGAQFTLSFPFDSNFSARKKMALKFINKQGGAGGGGDDGSGGAGGNGVEVNIGVETADGSFQYERIMTAGGGGGGGAHENGTAESRGGRTLSYTQNNYPNERFYYGADGTGGIPGGTASFYRGRGGTTSPGNGGFHGYGGGNGNDNGNGGAGAQASHGRYYGGGGGGGGWKGGGGGGSEGRVAGGGGAASSYYWKTPLIISTGSETYTFNGHTLVTAANDSNTNNNVKVIVDGGSFAGEIIYNSLVSADREFDLTSVFKTFYSSSSDAILSTDDKVLSIDLSDYHDPDPDGDTLNYYIQNANNQGGSSFSLSGTSKNLTFTQGVFGFFTSTVQWYTNVTGFNGNSAIKTVTVHHNVTTGYKENGIDLYNLYARGTHDGTLPYSVTTSNYKVNGTDLIDIFERETSTIVNGSSNFIIKDDTNTYRTFDQIFKKK